MVHNPVRLVFLQEEETGTQTHTGVRPCENSGRRWPCTSQGERPQRKAALRAFQSCTLQTLELQEDKLFKPRSL